MLSKFKEIVFLNKINECWIFEYVLVMLFVVFGIIGWLFSYSYSGICIISLLLLLLFLFNDFKYFIPAGLCLIFSYNGGYVSSSFPFQLALYGGLFIFLALFYSVINFRLSLLKKINHLLEFFCYQFHA